MTASLKAPRPVPAALFARARFPEPAPARRPLAVTMLVANPCVNDSRVIHEAETLARAGHRMTVLCLQRDDLPRSQRINGVTYRRVRIGGTGPRALAGLAVREKRGRWVSAVHGLLVIPLYIPRIVYLIAVKLSWRRSGKINRMRRWWERPTAKRFLRFIRWPVSVAMHIAANVISRLARLVRRAGRFIAGPMLAYHRNTAAFRDPILGSMPDVIHAHDLNTLPAAVAAAGQCGAAVVFDSHELATLEHEKEPFHHRAYKRFKERSLIKEVAGIVTVSEGFADIFVEWYGVPRPVVFFNSHRFSPADTLGRDVRTDLGLPADVPLAVYIGGINPRRALSQLVEAMAFAPEIHVVKVGPRIERWETVMRGLALRHGVNERLHFLDPVPPDCIVHYCRTGDFAIVTRLLFSVQQEYSMPNKLFESVLAGLPVLAGDTAEIRRFVERFGVGMTVDCADPNALGAAMAEIYRRRDEFRPDADSIARIVEEFGWPAQASKLAALYETFAVTRQSTTDI